MKDAMQQFTALLQYLPPPERERIAATLFHAEKWHHGQLRESGEPYIHHPLAVAGYLARLEADEDTLIAALLHDVVEDGHTSMETLEQKFGKTIATLVDGVTKLSRLRYEGRRSEWQVASLRKMLLIASKDLRVILIKLADRWHNIETIDALRKDKRERIANETLDIYVPFARLVGLWELKTQLEDTCFPLAMPEEHRLWHEAIARVRATVDTERLHFIQQLNEETGENVEPQLQRMTDYEIFRKLQGNLQRLQDVQHVDSALVLLKGGHSSPLDCYRVLGRIHGLHTVHLGSFRDYIGSPQPNGYRALHTTIFLSHHHRLRLRIQTAAMYEYAAQRKISSWIGKKDTDLYAALRAVHGDVIGEEHYLRHLKDSILTERINIFTTSGEIVSLPEGATGVDFVFAVNPDHLSYLAGIRVNGHLREASHTLQDGDTVELVLLQRGNGKQTMWVEKVKSIATRQHLEKSLQQSPREQQMEEGKNILQRECRKRRLPLWFLFHLPTMQKQLTTALGESTFEELLVRLGGGLLPVSTVIDAYKRMLTLTPNWTIQCMKFLHLLPRSRVLNKEATLMDIEVYAEDRQGLIHDITECFVERNINIARFGVFAIPPKDALYKIRLETGSFDEFSDLFDALLQVPNVKNVLRKR